MVECVFSILVVLLYMWDNGMEADWWWSVCSLHCCAVVHRLEQLEL